MFVFTAASRGLQGDQAVFLLPYEHCDTRYTLSSTYTTGSLTGRPVNEVHPVSCYTADAHSFWFNLVRSI